MIQYIKSEANRARTENGALTHATTYSRCLDLFATAGALRGAEEQDILKRFMLAYTENAELTMKILFYARDVRGGLGERRFFRLCLAWLAENEPASVRKNLSRVAEYGRWDDILVLLDTPCEADALRLVRAQLEEDCVAAEAGGEVSLLAKWLPSVNASNGETVRRAGRIARFLGMSDAEYRKTLSRLRAQIRILENHLRERDYSFDYSRQPSGAMFKYRRAFLRNDGDRYRGFLDKVSRGEAVLHTGTLTPYELIRPFFAGRVGKAEAAAIDVAWRAQEDFSNGENALVVIDGSGSMYCGEPVPAAVALSLGIYFAERNTGLFRDHFITFSTTPRLVEIRGGSILEKLRYCAGFNEVANTDLQRVFELILQAAVRHHVPREEMPSTLYIISDMEFDSCTAGADMTNFQYAKKIFAQAGYELPRVVFWNVQSRNLQQPVTENEQGVALVSGCTSRLFSMLAGGRLTPLDYMLDILGTERYAAIVA